MSSFKVQPIYAEAIFMWLDAAFLDSTRFTCEDVLRSVLWNFKGGVLGDYPTFHANESSKTRFPNGSSTVLADKWDTSLDARALRDILRIRKAERNKKSRVTNERIASFRMLQFVSAEHRRESGTAIRVVSGLKGVYLIANKICSMKRDSSAPNSMHLKKMFTYVREMMVASASASMVPVDVVADLTESAIAAVTESDFATWDLFIRDLERITRESKSGKVRQRVRSLGASISEGCIGEEGLIRFAVDSSSKSMCRMRCTLARNAIFVRLPGTLVVLANSDAIRLRQFFMSACSGLIATICQCAYAPGAERKRLKEVSAVYSNQVSSLASMGARVKIGEEVQICKAAKRAFTAFMGELAGPIAAEDTKVLWTETMETPFANEKELRSYIQRIRGWSAGTAFNLGKVYKICPAADTCPGMTLIDRHQTVCNANLVDQEIMEEFAAEHRTQMLRCVIRSPGVVLPLRDAARVPKWMNDYLARRFDMVPSIEINEYLAWEGSMDFKPRSPANAAVWKDSGLGWDSVEIANDVKKDKRHGNLLLRMVFDPDCPMPGEMKFATNHVHKLDRKSENYKDPSRGIYSGNAADRMVQSDMEVNVERVARLHPSFMIGADTVTKEMRIKTLMARTFKPGVVSVYYSFDISAWSPKMASEPQRISHKFWGDLYDCDLFRKAHVINEDATIYMNKAGYRGWYKNPSANLEGYNGKEMTCILITLLSLAVRRWRVKLVNDGRLTQEQADVISAVLLAYIDDGMAKLELPLELAEDLFQDFRSVVIDTFSRCGYNIEITKCFPSDRFWIFLNEVYLLGRHVVHGSRAAMTICSENTERHTTLTERVESVAAGCRGAVVAGLDPAVGSFLMAYHVSRHIAEWAPEMDPTLAAVWSVLPRAWGGLGTPTMLQLGTSGGGAALAESAHTMQCYARHNMTARRVFLSCMRDPMVTRTAASILASPLGGKLSSGVMTSSRMPAVIRDSLTFLRERDELSPLASEFLSYSSFDNFSSFAEALVPSTPGSVIQKQVVDDVKQIHMHTIFSAFATRLEKSSTLLQIVPSRKVNQMIRANRRDVKESVDVVTDRSR